MTLGRRSMKTGGSRALLVALACAATAACVGSPPEGAAQTAQASGSNCAPAEAEPTRLYRQLSLALRGAPPTMEELAAVRAARQVTPAMVDAMLRSDTFLEQVSHWHADLLWPNLDGFLIQMGGLRLTRGGTNPEVNLDILDARTNEATCPTSGNGALTAASCCTATNPRTPRAASHDAAATTRRTPRAWRSLAASAPRTPSVRASATARSAAAAARRAATTRSSIRRRASPRATRRGCATSTGGPTTSRLARTRVGTTTTATTSRSPTTTGRTARATAAPSRAAAPAGPSSPQIFAPRSASKRAARSPATTPRQCPTGYTEVVNTCDNTVTGNSPEIALRIRREGYRMMRPYWAEGHWVKVCAYEAQDRSNSVYTGAMCNPAARIDASCGCGPDGVYCSPSQGRLSALPTATERRIREALNEEPLRIVASVVARDEDYYNAYTTRRSFITGPLSTLFREQTARMSGLSVTPPADASMLPRVDYGDETWHEYVRGPEHSGVLTTAAFLGRFPTWRSRINRFRTALLCRPFEPPAGGLPPPEDACNREPNLAHRCGCQHCHSSIEPLSAYWGRWAERSSIYLDPSTFPAYDPNCAQCANTGQFCTARCRSFYVTSVTDGDGSRYAGTLFSALYRSPDEMNRMEQGPSALVAQALSNGEFQSCTTTTLWRRLVGRPMNEDETRRVLPELLRQFEASQHNYRALVRAIVTAPAYRRID
ncbi:MAG: hypothetical protein U0326_27780 [Polyangiales bacterium]